MAELGTAPEATFATNVVFAESRNAHELDLTNLLEPCWRVHQLFMALVRPRVVVCLGNGEALSAFSIVRQKAVERHGDVQRRQFKGFEAGLQLTGDEILQVTVVGVRHP